VTVSPGNKAHLVRGDQLGQVAECRHSRRVMAGCGCGAVPGIGAAGSGSRRCAIALEEAGQLPPPPAARVPLTPGRCGAGLLRSFTLSVLVPRILREIDPAGWPGAPKVHP
jgi:hypothetical protein